MSKLYLELVIIKDTISRIKTQGNNWGKLFTKCTNCPELSKDVYRSTIQCQTKGKKKRQFTEEES